MTKTEDEKALLNIFPNELWTVVMENVKTARSYQKVSGTCSYFESFLKPQRTTLLFPEIAKLLVNQYLACECEGLLTQAVLNCREVCRAWKTGMDNILQNLDWYSEFPSVWNYEREFEETFNKGCFARFQSSQDFKDFQEHFEKTHSKGQANPFVCGGVAFVLEQYISLESYYFDWAELLEMFGHHIRYCDVHLALEDRYQSDPTIQLEFYKKLAQMLCLMPNLKAIEFFVRYSGPARKRLLHTWKWNNNVAYQIQFPNLPYLNYLALKGMPFPFMEKIVQMNPQVGIVDARYSATQDELKIYWEQMPNLTRFAIYNVAGETLQLIRSVSLVNKIDSLLLEAPYDCSWNVIFDVLETDFAENLTELTLFLPILQRQSTWRYYPTLQYLTTVDIRLRSAESLDFMLELAPNLEKFYVKTNRFEDDLVFKTAKKIERVINLYHVWKTPHKSNMWELFPKLGVIKILLWPAVCVGTRTDWEKYQDKLNLLK